MKSSKEKRREYRGAKSVSKSCRNHGSCPWCQNNRNHKHYIREDSSNYIMKEDLLDLL